MKKDLNKVVEKIKIDEEKIELGKIYEEIIENFNYYCDLPENLLKLLAIWVIGAVHINSFNTFPYLFINAMKGSGKTRLLKLLMKMTGGDVLNSPTEAVLFRTSNPLGIDEFEGVGRKGNESIRELLNSAYKKGIMVKRMKKKRTPEGEEQVVEEFSVYRAMAIANIWGMEEVLGDRCIKVVLDKSNNPIITKKIEKFDHLKEIQCRLCRVVTVFKLYNDIEDAWNSYITDKHTPLTTLTTHTPLTTLTTSLKGIINENLSFFNKIDDSGLEGRILELSFPLLYIASILSEETFDSLLVVLKNLSKERNEEDVIENYDVSLIDFVSQEVEDGKFVRIKELVKNFKEYLQSDDEWINERWLGRGLKRLNLIKQKRRKSRGREVILDIAKAQKKIRMFR